MIKIGLDDLCRRTPAQPYFDKIFKDMSQYAINRHAALKNFGADPESLATGIYMPPNFPK